MRETKVSKKRNVSQAIIDNFWGLSDPNSMTRDKSVEVIKNLLLNEEKSKNVEGINYTLTRLIRGTLSANGASRKGFTVLLAEVLVSIKSVSVNHILTTAENEIGLPCLKLPPDKVIAWCLVISAIIQSNSLKLDQDPTNLDKILKYLLIFGCEKNYVEIMVCFMIENLLENSKHSQKIVEKLISSINGSLDSKQKEKPFALYIGLISKRYSNLSFDKLNNIINLEDHEQIAKAVLNCVSYIPTIHPFATELVDIIIKEDNFENFWNKTLNHTIFVSSGSDEARFLGYKLIIHLLPHLNTSNVSVIINPIFLKSWLLSLSNRNHSLSPCANELANSMLTHFKTYQGDLQLMILNCLTEPPGSIMFDDLTRSKLFKNLLSEVQSQAVEPWCAKLLTLLKETEIVSRKDILRNTCVNQLSIILKSAHISSMPDLKLSIMKFFWIHSYFNVSKDKMKLNQPPTPELRASLKSALRIGLQHGNLDVDIMKKLILYISKILQKAKMACIVSTPMISFWDRVVEQLKILEDDNEANEDKVKIFKPIFCLLALDAFDLPQDVSQIFEEINECYQRAIKGINSPNEPYWADVLTDIIISLIPQSSGFFSTALVKTFAMVCKHITLVGLEQLKSSLFVTSLNDDTNAEESMDEDDEEENNEEAEDEEIGKEKNEVDDDDLEDEDESDLEDEEAGTVAEEFRNRVLQALGPAAAGDEDSEMVLNDDEMFELDEALAEVFRSHYKKADCKKNEETLRQFKLKCLDMIQLVIDQKCSSLQYLLEIAKILVSTLKKQLSARDEPILDKCCKIIISLSKIDSFNETSAKNLKESTKSLLEFTIKACYKIPRPNVHKACSRLCLWIIKTGGQFKQNLNWHESIILEALDDHFKKSTCYLSKEFFLVFIEKVEGFSKVSLKTLLDNSFADLRPFKKASALNLLNLIISKSSLDDDLDLKPIIEDIKNGIDANLEILSSNKSSVINEFVRLVHQMWSLLTQESKDKLTELCNQMPSKIRKGLSKQSRSYIRQMTGSCEQSGINTLENGHETEMKDEKDALDNEFC